jgi:hypothetical protein
LLGQGTSSFVVCTRRIDNCSSAIGGQQVNCSAIEFVDITPPSGQTCGQYMDPYISFAGGYLTNPDATSACNFCGVRTTDDLMAINYNIFYSHRWRNLGFIMVFILFNVRFFRLRVFCILADIVLFRYSALSCLPICSAYALVVFSHLSDDLRKHSSVSSSMLLCLITIPDPHSCKYPNNRQYRRS